MSKYYEVESQSRIELSKKMYQMIERRLTDFLEYVPLDVDHLDVHSLKLVTVILETGPEILSSFDIAVFKWKGVLELFGEEDSKRKELLMKEQKLKRRNLSLGFNDYYNYLESYYGLKELEITIPDLKSYIMPFETKHPEWWNCYNLLRHDKYANLKKATLRNALKALGALFLLINYNTTTTSDKVPPSNIFIKPLYQYIDHSEIKGLQKI